MSDNYRFAAKISQMSDNQARLVLDPDLESRLNKIVTTIPNEVKQNVYDKYGKSLLLETCASNQVQQNYLNKLSLKDLIPKTTRAQGPVPDFNDFKSSYSTRNREPGYFFSNFSQGSFKKGPTEADFRGSPERREKSSSIHPSAENIAENMEILNQRIEKVMQSTQRIINTPRGCLSDTQRIDYTSPSKAIQLGKSTKPPSFNFKNLYSDELKSKVFLSEQKVQSPNQTNAYQFQDFGLLSPRKRSNLSLEEKFNMTIQRSQAIQRQEIDKADVKQSFQKTKKLLENLESVQPIHKDYLGSVTGTKFQQIYESPSADDKQSFRANALEGMPASEKPAARETLNASESYLGDKLDGKRHGRGTFYAEDGSKYEGEWEHDLRSGYGLQTFSNGEAEYEGEWLRDKYHGAGNLNNKNPKKINESFDYKDFGKLGFAWVNYQGEFELGKWHGLGTLYLSNGEKFSGRFKSGEACGTGTFCQKSGETIPGEWQGNKYIASL